MHLIRERGKWKICIILKPSFALLYKVREEKHISPGGLSSGGKDTVSWPHQQLETGQRYTQDVASNVGQGILHLPLLSEADSVTHISTS